MSQLSPTEINIALVVLGGLVYVYGLLSRFIKERLFLSGPILAVLVGIIFGPIALNIFDPKIWGNQELILEQAARVAIAIQLMSTALRLRSGYPFRNWRSLGIFLGLVMPLMWLGSGLLVYLILKVDFWVALLISAVITPTDPVLAAMIVTGEFAENNLPSRVRNLISAESGINDGLAYPFVFLPILMLTRPTGEALNHWFTSIILWEVGGAIVFGGVAGYAAGRLLKWAQSKKPSIDNLFWLICLPFPYWC